MLTPGGSLLPCASCPCMQHICDGTCRLGVCSDHDSIESIEHLCAPGSLAVASVKTLVLSSLRFGGGVVPGLVEQHGAASPAVHMMLPNGQACGTGCRLFQGQLCMRGLWRHGDLGLARSKPHFDLALPAVERCGRIPATLGHCGAKPL